MSYRTKALAPSKRILKVVARGLEEIRDHYVWEEVAWDEDQGSEEDSLAEEEYGDAVGVDDDDVYEETYPESSFDRVHVEILIDTFLSRLIRKKIIRKDDEPSSLYELFLTFWGEEHEVTLIAQRFEDHIKGYFGFIQYDDMRAAYSELLAIQDVIKKELEDFDHG